ncbi:unnamed protein product [Rotaria magnacalcarata]|uniref:Methyltransferase domain-containing protein n=1 Tax=Rotaria magnacalcarata TaxID=392030 RepID=A0A8S2IN84_9BILA|nr:unnamed protein product [Rotaria magnacalcarata]
MSSENNTNESDYDQNLLAEKYIRVKGLSHDDFTNRRRLIASFVADNIIRLIKRGLSYLNYNIPVECALDVGCGEGHMCRVLIEEKIAQYVVGIDKSKEMIKYAKANSNDGITHDKYIIVNAATDDLLTVLGKKSPLIMQINMLCHAEDVNQLSNILFNIAKQNTANFDIKSLILPFNNPFWVNEKRWLVSCDYIITKSKISLYTTPRCVCNVKTESTTLQISSTDNICHVIFDEMALMRLSLSYNKIGNDGAQYLYDALKENKKLFELNLEENIGKYCAIVSVAIQIRNDDSLYTTDLVSMEIGDNETQFLADALQNNNTINQLNLSSNDIGDIGAEHLAHALQNNKRLTSLIFGFDYKYIQHEHYTIGFLRLADSELDEKDKKRKSRLRTWPGNRIGDRGTQYLADALQMNKTLVVLNLAYNQVGNDGARYLAKLLQNNTTLAKLILRNQREGYSIEDVGAYYLADALKQNQTLTLLDLAGNKIGDTGAKYFADALEKNQTLTILDLESNLIQDDGMKYLLDAVKNNKTLTTLDLSHNQLSNDGARYLFEVLKDNKTLENLKLEGNIGNFCTVVSATIQIRNEKTSSRINLQSKKINDDDVRLLADALSNTERKSIELDLSSNEIGDVGAQCLARALQNNKTSTKLSLLHNKIGIIGIQYLFDVAISQLDISINSIGDTEMQQIFNLLRNNEAITKLELNANNSGDHASYYISVKHATMNIRRKNRFGNAEIKYLADILQNDKVTYFFLNEFTIDYDFFINQAITELDLSSNEIGDMGAECLARVLQNSKNAVKMNIIWKNRFGDTETKYLADALQSDKAITELDLSSNEIGDIGAGCLARVLENSKTLLKLSLSNNRIGVKGIQYLIDALRTNETISRLDLVSNITDDTDVQQIFNLLQNNETITELDLSYNEIGDVEAQYLAEVLRNNTTITVLDISKNEISDIGMQHFADMLQHNQTLTTLDLCSNEIDDMAMKSLSDALENHTMLITLDLAENQIQDFGAQCLARILKRSKTLTTLILRSNQIAQNGAQYISDALEHNPILVTLDFGRNIIGDFGAKHIATLLRNNKTLVNLTLTANKIGANGIEYLSDALEHNTTLTTLDLGWNEIRDPEAQRLASVIKNNKVTLAELDLSGDTIEDNGAEQLIFALRENTVT